MSQDLDSNKPSTIQIGQNVAGVGFIGAWLTSIVESFVEDALIEKNLILSVPFFSICIIEAFRWIFACFSPQNANEIKLRRLLDKKQKQVEKDLKNPNYSEDHKKELQKTLENISLDRINSFSK